MAISGMVFEDVVPFSISNEGRYRLLNQLGSGGMGRVFRAFDRLTGEMVALKRLHTPAGANSLSPIPTPSLPESSTDPRLTLAREFQAMSTLRHPNILGVLDYGFNQSQPYFTMELLDKAETIVEYAQNKPYDVQLQLIIQVLQALAYIHRRELLHRDLKPGNILVANEQVKVLDFGLSIDISQAKGTVGTLAYMPPEILFGHSGGIPSDLYSFGLIAYEILAGRHPFQQKGSSQVDVMNYFLDDDSARLDFALLPPVLRPILRQLLAWQPETRYQEATAVIADLAQATNQSFPQETMATRESFLQAARFVGREVEFEQLKNALIRAMDGHGAAWLIGGESGVGKSRMASELRIQALIRGGLVLRGQAITNGGGPFSIWRDILRLSVLLTPLSDLEAGVLKAILPEIDNLLEREVLPPPDLSPADAQVRLFSVVTDVIRRQEQPVVIILEDLHWATPESLALLNWLKRFVAAQPWLIIGNYRDDEQADLPQRLPGFQLMKLKRLLPEAIAVLSHSMLGDTGRKETLLTFLQHETEGNPFFLVEIVRTLAEEVGQLDKIGIKTLPEHVFTGGLKNLVKRRLGRVPPAGQELLQLAAVAGRRLDLKLLQAVDPTFDLASWLDDCVNAAILDFQDERWQFAHDKLREGVLIDLPAGQRPAIHRQIAQTMEMAYPNRPDTAATLAYHWAMVGDASKEAHYATIAGQESLRSGANQAAANYLLRVLELDQQGARLSKQVPYLEQLRIRRQLGQAYLGLGRLEDSLQVLTEALEMANRPIPDSKPLLVSNLLFQIGRQVAHRLRPGWFTASAKPEQAAILLESARNYQQVAEIYYFTNKREPLLHAGLRVLNLAERAGPSPEMARACGNMSIIAGLVGLGKVAEAYCRLALETAQQTANLPAIAWTFLTTATYTIGQGQWARSVEMLERAIVTSKQIGDQRILGLALGVRQLVPYHQGQFAESAMFSQEWYRTAHESDNSQHQLMSLVTEAENQMRLGQIESALQTLARTDDLFTATSLGSVYSEKYRAHGIRAAVYLRQDDLAAAGREADLAFELMPRVSAPNQIIMADGITNVAEVYLTLWAKGEERYQSLAQQACQLVNRYGRVFAIVGVRASLLQGFYQQLKNDPARAQRLWQKGLALATELGMVYEQGLAYDYLGRYGPRPERLVHLTQAANIFRSLETIDDLARVELSLSFL